MLQNHRPWTYRLAAGNEGNTRLGCLNHIIVTADIVHRSYSDEAQPHQLQTSCHPYGPWSKTLV